MSSSGINQTPGPSQTSVPDRVANSLNGGSRFMTDAARLRSEADSWVEISSQPSSSSLSSTTTDEIVTTGLRVRRQLNARRRRLHHADRSALHGPVSRPGSASSSQEEYEESESEDDRIMTSSNENLEPSQPPEPSRRLRAEPAYPPEEAEDGDEDADDDDDDDENSTALGVPDEGHVFTPQPNAFSHPPSSPPLSQPAPTSYFPRPIYRPLPQGRALSGRHRQQHTPFNVVSPSYQADHDAALRASLSTLLSCAAAARGLPKQNHPSGAGQVAGPSVVEPSTIRIVPESALGDRAGSTDATPQQDSKRRFKSRSPSDVSSREHPTSPDKVKGKRKAAQSPSRGAKDRAAKKTKRIYDDAISPTLLTWVVSAGVVVLVSALGFSAGYAMGKEVGRAEVGLGSGAGPEGPSSCGKEVAARGLRKLRWGASGAASVRV
ncbi:MAG: hypothetical protein M1837_002587 [Sclerophora amabilis]|nr:MAG: hypothetical protein M1837_002587 [Sclerophora amabilis]